MTATDSEETMRMTAADLEHTTLRAILAGAPDTRRRWLRPKTTGTGPMPPLRIQVADRLDVPAPHARTLYACAKLLDEILAQQRAGP